MRRCAAKRCRGIVTESARSPWCSRCRSRRFKEKFPLKYYFNLLKSGANRRGKDFSLTFAEYEEFCLKTDYHKLKGKTSLSLSIDRKRNAEGYHKNNIQAITVRENCRKDYAPRMREYMDRVLQKNSVARTSNHLQIPNQHHEQHRSQL